MLRASRRRSLSNRAIKQGGWFAGTIAAVSAVAGAAVLLWAQAPAPVRFAIVGDRTGETVPGVYEAVWREMAAAKPAFVLGTGDSIQGMDDAAAENEWREFDRMLEPFRSIPYYQTPGNHDIWSEASAKLFAAHAGHAPDYSFDRGGAHFTILDNSRDDNLQPAEMAFLEQDLKAHAAAPVKFIVSHRPSWLLSVVVRNPAFPLQQLAEKYGARYVIAGHVHEMMHGSLDGVEYISAPSAGGHLRASGKYQDGWFFGYILVTVNGASASFEIHELPPPHGEARVTPLSAWGAAGLVSKAP